MDVSKYSYSIKNMNSLCVMLKNETEMDKNALLWMDIMQYHPKKMEEQMMPLKKIVLCILRNQIENQLKIDSQSS